MDEDTSELDYAIYVLYAHSTHKHRNSERWHEEKKKSVSYTHECVGTKHNNAVGIEQCVCVYARRRSRCHAGLFK